MLGMTVVVEDQKIIGIITDGDLRRMLLAVRISMRLLLKIL